MLKKIFQISVCLMVLGLGSTLAFADASKELKDQQLKVLESLEKVRATTSIRQFRKAAAEAMAVCNTFQERTDLKTKKTLPEIKFAGYARFCVSNFDLAAFYMYDCRIEGVMNSCDKYPELLKSASEDLDAAWEAFRIMHPEP